MCAHAVRVAMQKIEGVSAVTVSLNEGTVAMRLTPSNRVTIDQIREAIRSNGFSPKAAEVRVAGRVTMRGDSLLLTSPETNETYVLEDLPGGQRIVELRRSVGARVVIAGTVLESSRRRAIQLHRLVVRSFEFPARE